MASSGLHFSSLPLCVLSWSSTCLSLNNLQIKPNQNLLIHAGVFLANNIAVSWYILITRISGTPIRVLVNENAKRMVYWGGQNSGDLRSLHISTYTNLSSRSWVWGPSRWGETLDVLYGKAGCHTNLHEQDLLLYRCSACCSLSHGCKRYGWTLHGTWCQQTNQQQSGATTRKQPELNKQWSRSIHGCDYLHENKLVLSNLRNQSPHEMKDWICFTFSLAHNPKVISIVDYF